MRSWPHSLDGPELDGLLATEGHCAPAPRHTGTIRTSRRGRLAEVVRVSECRLRVEQLVGSGKNSEEVAR